MKIKKLCILLGLVALVGKLSFGQLSDGGSPVTHGFELKSADGENLLLIERPNIDSLLNHVRHGLEKKDIAAVAVDLDLDVLERGESWEYQEGRVFELALQSKDATGLIVHFSEFELPVGARVFVYNDNAILGAYTHKNNKSFGSLTLQELRGESAKIQVYVPRGKEVEVSLRVGNVGYGFTQKNKTAGDGGPNMFGLSLPCNNGINSKHGAFHQKEKRSVVLMIHLEYAFYVRYTAVLVNNYKQDGTPYFLTAKHCFEKVFSNREFHAEYAETCVAHFNYESLSTGENGEWDHTISGAEVLAYDPTEWPHYYDLVLLKFGETPPEEYKPYYAAIKAEEPEITNKRFRNNNTQGNGNFTVIHHPSGDVKKISYYEWVVSIDNDYDISLSDNDGITEKGSSGSPLFDKDHYVVGVLSGGTGGFDEVVCDVEWEDVYALLERTKSILPGLDTFLFAKGAGRIVEAYDPYEEESRLLFYPSSLKIDHDEEMLECRNVSSANYSNFRWDFGTRAEPQTHTGAKAPQVKLLELGYHKVSLTALNSETGKDETFVVDSLIQCRYGKACPHFVISDKKGNYVEEQSGDYLCELSDTLYLYNLSLGASDGYIYTIGETNPIVIETGSKDELTKILPFTQAFLNQHDYIQQAYYVPVKLWQKHPEQDTIYERILRIHEPTIAAYNVKRINHFNREMPDDYYLVNEVEFYADNMSTGYDIRCRWYVNGVLKEEGRAGDFSFMATEPGLYEFMLIVSNSFSSDTTTIKIEYHLAVGVDDIQDTELKVYPILCQNTVYIDNTQEEIQLKVYDISGKIISEKLLSREEKSIDVSSLKCGIYFLCFQSEQRQRTVKIIKQ